MLRRYRRTRSVSVRNQLLERYRGVVESIARHLASRLPRSVDVQDLVHAGLWGLIQALDHFEPERGTHFLPFMRIRVRGAMVDELRHLDFLPRLLRSRQRECEAVRARLRDTLMREPSDLEVAKALGVSEEVLRRRYDVAVPVQRAMPRREASYEGDESDTDLMDALADDAIEAPFEAVHRRELLEMISQSLDPIEWTVLRLYYLEGMSGKDVARKLRLSASRICRIHLRVLSRLKARLAACS